MLGRGVLANPALFGEIRGTQALTKQRLWEFHERLLADYSQEMSGERNVLFKMKELWFYLACCPLKIQRNMRKKSGRRSI